MRLVVRITMGHLHVSGFWFSIKVQTIFKPNPQMQYATIELAERMRNAGLGVKVV